MLFLTNLRGWILASGMSKGGSKGRYVFVMNFQLRCGMWVRPMRLFASWELRDPAAPACINPRQIQGIGRGQVRWLQSLSKQWKTSCEAAAICVLNRNSTKRETQNSHIWKQNSLLKYDEICVTFEKMLASLISSHWPLIQWSWFVMHSRHLCYITSRGQKRVKSQEMFRCLECHCPIQGNKVSKQTPEVWKPLPRNRGANDLGMVATWTTWKFRGPCFASFFFLAIFSQQFWSGGIEEKWEPTSDHTVMLDVFEFFFDPKVVGCFPMVLAQSKGAISGSQISFAIRGQYLCVVQVLVAALQPAIWHSRLRSRETRGDRVWEVEIFQSIIYR